jgi:hypothetical protein
MNYGTIQKITNTPNSNISSQCEYEIHRLCEEQIHKQRQRKTSRIVSCRYLIENLFFIIFSINNK